MIFSVFQKNRVFGYSWSTLLWYRCYYPHRSRDALSPVCGIFVRPIGLYEIWRSAIKNYLYFLMFFIISESWSRVTREGLKGLSKARRRLQGWNTTAGQEDNSTGIWWKQDTKKQQQGRKTTAWQESDRRGQQDRKMTSRLEDNIIAGRQQQEGKTTTGQEDNRGTGKQKQDK